MGSATILQRYSVDGAARRPLTTAVSSDLLSDRRRSFARHHCCHHIHKACRGHGCVLRLSVRPSLSPTHRATHMWSLACSLVWHPGAAPAHCKRRGRLSGRGLVCRHHRTVTRGTAASQPHSALDWATGTRCSAVRQVPQSWHVSFGARVVPPGAHGVVASHPLRMRKALGSNPSVSIECVLEEWTGR